jgi:hypothetical protein
MQAQVRGRKSARAQQGKHALSKHLVTPRASIKLLEIKDTTRVFSCLTESAKEKKFKVF